MMQAFFIKAGEYLFLGALFCGLIVFLRFLFGPKGIWRDPSWLTIEQAEAAAVLEKEKAAASGAPRPSASPALPPVPEGLPLWMREPVRVFMEYGAGFFSDDPHITSHVLLKIEHTLRVVDTANAILQAESCLHAEPKGRVLLLAALYHDIGRFEQFTRYRTFSDAHSRNHGHLGVRVLHRLGLLRGEGREVRNAIFRCVGLHNRFVLPASHQGLAHDPLLALRDADKIDILRVMRGNLGPGAQPDDAVVMHLENRPGAYSPEIMRALEEGRVASFLDMRFINDFRLLLCTWTGELRFAASRKIVRQEGTLDSVLDALADLPEAREKARALVDARLRV